MANIRLIKRRIRSVESTAKITKAMEMIAASKMRRTQERALAGRPYAEKIHAVIAGLAARVGQEAFIPALMVKRPVKKIEVIHISADRGLCGGLNANINRHTASFLIEQKASVEVIAVGQRGRDYMVRYKRAIRAEFSKIGDSPRVMDISPIARLVTDDYANGYVDEVLISYTRFQSTMVQRPEIEQLLPIEPAPMEAGADYIYEPSSSAVLEKLLPRFVEMTIYHALLESIASEQSARMVAMRNATDNARELVKDLTLTYNKVRQENITKELLDIVGGSSGLT